MADCLQPVYVNGDEAVDPVVGAVEAIIEK
jgi:hypothetical protein